MNSVVLYSSNWTAVVFSKREIKVGFRNVLMFYESLFYKFDKYRAKLSMDKPRSSFVLFASWVLKVTIRLTTIMFLALRFVQSLIVNKVSLQIFTWVL